MQFNGDQAIVEISFLLLFVGSSSAKELSYGYLQKLLKDYADKMMPERGIDTLPEINDDKMPWIKRFDADADLKANIWFLKQQNRPVNKAKGMRPVKVTKLKRRQRPGQFMLLQINVKN